MTKTIEDFLEALPKLEGGDEARMNFKTAENTDNFQKIELYGIHEISREGIQMVYAIGTGKMNYSTGDEDALFYSPCLITRDFFGSDSAKQGSSDSVRSIPVSRIIEIRPLEVSKEKPYSRQT